MILIEELLAALSHVKEHLAGCEGSAVVFLVSAHLVNKFLGSEVVSVPAKDFE